MLTESIDYIAEKSGHEFIEGIPASSTALKNYCFSLVRSGVVRYV